MEGIQDAYATVRDIWRVVYPWIPFPFVRSFQTLYYQSIDLFHAFLEDPSDIKPLIPSIISVLTLAVSLYWTVTHTLRIMRTAFRVTIFVLKYGLIAFVLFGGASYFLNDETGNDTNALSTVWNTLARNAAPLIFPTTPPTRTTSTTTSRKQQQRKHGKPWEKFATPPASNTRSKVKAKKTKTKASSKVTDNDESWWSGAANGGGSMAQYAIQYAVQKVWNTARTTEWPSADAIPEALREPWENIQDELRGVLQPEEEEDAGTRSR